MFCYWRSIPGSLPGKFRVDWETQLWLITSASSLVVMKYPSHVAGLGSYKVISGWIVYTCNMVYLCFMACKWYFIRLLIFSVVSSSCFIFLWTTCSQRTDSLLEESKSGECQLLMSLHPLWLSGPVWLQDIVAMCGHDLDTALFLPSDVCSSTWDSCPKHRPCTQQWVGKSDSNQWRQSSCTCAINYHFRVKLIIRLFMPILTAHVGPCLHATLEGKFGQKSIETGLGEKFFAKYDQSY